MLGVLVSWRLYSAAGDSYNSAISPPIHPYQSPPYHPRSHLEQEQQRVGERLEVVAAAGSPAEVRVHRRVADCPAEDVGALVVLDVRAADRVLPARGCGYVMVVVVVDGGWWFGCWWYGWIVELVWC